MRILFAIVTIFAFTVECFANDSVKVSYETGDNLLGNADKFELIVTRGQPGDPKVDKYFRTIQDILKKASALYEWERAGGIHVPLARIEIVLGSQRYSYVANYEDGGVPISLPEAEVDRRHRKVFDQIMRMTAERTRILAGANRRQ